MREIRRIFVHCTASWKTATLEDIKAEFKKKNWKAPGYHYVVDYTGKIHQIWPEDKVSNGVKGYNETAINVAYIGGIENNGEKIVEKDTRTPAQKSALVSVLTMLKKKYPHAKIMGHRDISPDANHNGKVDPNERIKECPCFDAMIEYKNI